MKRNSKHCGKSLLIESGLPERLLHPFPDIRRRHLHIAKERKMMTVIDDAVTLERGAARHKCSPKELSRTELRHLDAARVIPDFVLKLLARSTTVTERDLELLYGEYRQYHRSRAPFRSRMPAASGRYYEPEVCELLKQLFRPDQISKWEAHSLLLQIGRLVPARVRPEVVTASV